MKLLRILTTALYIIYLEYPTYNRGVWLYDANINYLAGNYIPFFLVALLVYLFIFFTLFVVIEP